MNTYHLVHRQTAPEYGSVVTVADSRGCGTILPQVLATPAERRNTPARSRSRKSTKHSRIYSALRVSCPHLHIPSDTSPNPHSIALQRRATGITRHLQDFISQTSLQNHVLRTDIHVSRGPAAHCDASVISPDECSVTVPEVRDRRCWDTE